jgi:hypothetical protein
VTLSLLLAVRVGKLPHKFLPKRHFWRHGHLGNIRALSVSMALGETASIKRLTSGSLLRVRRYVLVRLTCLTLLWIFVPAAGTVLRAQAQDDRPEHEERLPDEIQDSRENDQRNPEAEARLGQQAQPAPDVGPTPAQPPLTFEERLRIYRRSLIRPRSFVTPALGATMAQIDNKPPEWGGGMAGFGRRLASHEGRSAVNRTIAFGVAAAIGEDPRSYPSKETDFWKRVRHAVVRNFVSRNDNGDPMPAYSRFAGSYGAAFVSMTWEAPSQDGVGRALKRGTTSVATGVGWRVLEEFTPDIRGLFKRIRP